MVFGLGGTVLDLDWELIEVQSRNRSSRTPSLCAVVLGPPIQDHQSHNPSSTRGTGEVRKKKKAGASLSRQLRRPPLAGRHRIWFCLHAAFCPVIFLSLPTLRERTVRLIVLCACRPSVTATLSNTTGPILLPLLAFVA